MFKRKEYAFVMLIGTNVVWCKHRPHMEVYREDSPQAKCLHEYTHKTSVSGIYWKTGFEMISCIVLAFLGI